MVAASFLLGALAIMALTLKLPLAALLAIVALVGIGTSGTQTLIYGFAANYFPTRVRGAGVAWCAGFGRLGGVGGHPATVSAIQRRRCRSAEDAARSPPAMPLRRHRRFRHRDSRSVNRPARREPRTGCRARRPGGPRRLQRPDGRRVSRPYDGSMTPVCHNPPADGVDPARGSERGDIFVTFRASSAFPRAEPVAT